MKKKRLILTTVLLACVAAVVVVMPEKLWRPVFYSKMEYRCFDTTYGFYQQRLRWLPGPDHYVPDQVCDECVLGPGLDHADPAYCTTERLRKGDELVFRFDETIPTPANWQCTCPDPEPRVEPMKRKRLILTTALLACVAAVVVPFRRDIWLFLAYERHSGWEVHCPTLDCFEKRASWLPGELVVVPNSVCQYCYFADNPEKHKQHIGASEVVPERERLAHFHCWSRYPGMEISYLDGFRFKLDAGMWYCTCPDPSHEWNQ